MNSLTKRKITAVAVSLMLVVAIVTTCILCAPRFDNNNDGVVGVSNTDVSYTQYTQKLTRLYNRDEASVIHITDQDNSAYGVDIIYPKDIYVDKSENLSDIGYYFYFFMTGQSSGKDSWIGGGKPLRYQHYAMNLLGYFNNSAGEGKAYDQADDAGRKLMNTFNGYQLSYNINGTNTFGSLQSVYETADGRIPSGSDANRAASSNMHYGMLFNANKGSSPFDATITMFMRGNKPNSEGDFDYITTTFDQRDSANAKLMLMTTEESGGSGWSSKFATDFSSVSASSREFTGDWIHHLDANGNATHTNGKVTYDYTTDTKSYADGTTVPKMNIKIHVYDKNALATAINNLQHSVDELTNFAVATGGEGVNSIAAAQELIRQGTEILNVRNVSAKRVRTLTDAMNDFVFDVARPATTFPAWTFGDRDGGGKTYLSTIWNKYSADYAKYFTVNIQHKIYSEFDNTDLLNTINRNVVYNKDTYNSYAYVQDAGDYTIKFTPRDPDTYGSEIKHAVRWSSAGDDPIVAQITLTINRANMDVYPASVPNRGYNGEAQNYSMATDGSIVQLKGEMQSQNADLVVKLLKNNPGATNHTDWDQAGVGNSINFTEVGEHTVYYRIQAKNHLAYTGSYNVNIVPGDVVVTFGAQSINKNADGGTLTYGDDVLSSEDIISQGVLSVKVNGNDSNVINKDALNNILSLGLFSNGAFVTDNLAQAGNHAVKVKDYKAVTQSDVERAENPSITSWNQRINVTLADESSCYKIAKKEINIVWGELAEQIYDGLGNHRPTADVKAGDEVAGGEVFTFSTYILKGDEVGLSGDNAGRITVDGVEYEVPLTEGNNAIWAGAYVVGIQYNKDDSNYVVSNDTATTDFEIKQREIHINVLDKDSDYARAINEERSVNAESVRDIYQNVMFNSNTGINKVYEFVDGTSLAIAGSASRVFEVDIVNVPTTNDSNHGSPDSFYCAGVHTNALIARLRSADEVDSKGEAIDMNRIRSYNLTYTAGTLTVYEAEIESSRSYMRKTFDGTEQEFTLNPQRIGLTGYEEIHKEEDGVVEFVYSESISGPFTTTPITLRNYAESNKIIYYKVSAANHKTTEVKSFIAYIDKLAIDVTLGGQTTKIYYGDEIPDSQGIMDALNITYECRKSDFDEDQTPSDFVIDGKLQFFISLAGQKVTDRKVGMGLYTIDLEPVDTSVNFLDNYNITYSGRTESTNDNEQALEISKRPLIVDWRQSGSNWIDDGMHFVYNATAPNIQPTVRAFRNADLSGYNENSTGANTYDDNTEGTVENYVEGDVIKLRDQTLSGSTYSVEGYQTQKTELSDPNHIKNYTIVNPTARYYINQRTVKINVFDQSATYGNAKSVAMGTLISSKEKGANWEYNDSNDYKFIRDHYMNWTLTSEAIEGGEKDYKNVGSYDIVLSEREGNDGAVANNYNIIVYTKHKDGSVEADPTAHNKAALFTIEKATLNIARREFNFDASPKYPGGGDNTPKERCYINVDEIRNIVKVVGATLQGEVSIAMSEAIQYGADGQVTGAAGDHELTTNREIEITARGKYYVWVRMTNSNYEIFEDTIDVNYLTNWISILLGDQITANYGDKVMTSEELFDALNVKEITGVMDESGNIELKGEAAWSAIQERKYFTLFVGKGDKTPLTTNERVDEYSVYMNVNAANVGEGENELHFRFIGEKIGQGVTSNVNVYKVIERPIYLQWNANVNETYGEHSDESASHKGYTLMNVLDGDDVRVEIEYKADEASYTPGEKRGNHVHYVGDYIATLIGVSHSNYRVAVVGDRIVLEDGSVVNVNTSHLEKSFSINKREITVTIEDQELVYGSLDARETADGTSSNNIYNFVNASSVYTVGGSGLYEEDKASDVFELKAIYTLEQGCNYLSVGEHRIRGNSKNTKIANQYELRFVRKDGGANERDAILTVTPADFTIDSMQFKTIFFDGKSHSPLGTGDNIASLSYTFAGDAEYAKANRRVYFNADVNATASSSGWKLARDKDGFYEEALRFRNAGVHKFAVMVETLNHNPRVRNDITFEILAVNVNINMTSQAKKTYGDVIYNGTEADISRFIKEGTNLTFQVTTGKDEWYVEGLEDAFIFYVVAGGENGVDSGAGVEAGNFANNAGTYRVYHKFADGESVNYNVTYTQNNGVGCNAKAFKIEPREVSVTWHILDENGKLNGAPTEGESGLIDAPTEFVYSGEQVGLIAKFVATRFNSSKGELENYNEYLYVDGAELPDARKTPYTASANFGIMKTVASNYTLKSDTTGFTFVINPREIDVILKNQGVTYGSEIVFNEGHDYWEVDDEEWEDIPNANMTLTLKLPTLGEGKKFVAAKDYEIHATCGNSNFVVTFKNEDGVKGWGKYTVAKATITNVPDHMEDLKYNGANQNVDIHKHIAEHLDTALGISGDMTWDDAIVTYKNANGEWVSAMPTVKDAGESVVEFMITLANHNNFEGSMTVNVSKANIVFNADVVEVQYGEKVLTSAELFERMNIRINSASDSIAVTLDKLVSFYISENAKNVGKYYLQTQILDGADKNFEVSLAQESEQTNTPYHIVPRIITVDWGNADRVYKGEDWYFTAVGFGNVMDGDTISTPTYSLIMEDGEYPAKARNVGDYKVKIFVNSSNANYVVDEASRYNTFTILPKEVEVEWDVKNFTYDGEGHMLEAKIVGGVLSGESCNIITYSAKVVSAGNHIASVVKLDNENYTVPEYATAEFTIEPKEVHIVWEVENFVYNGSNQCIKAYVNTSDLIGDDKCEVIVSGGGINAGTHRAIVSELKNSNYKLPEGGAGQEFSIAPRVIQSIVWSDTSLTYNEVNGVPQAQLPTATVGEGKVEGDTVEFEIFVEQGSAINAGSYRASVVGVNNINYILAENVTNDSTNFEIKKAENSLGNDIKLPVKDGGLPALADFESVSTKYGSPVVKYFKNAELTDEYTGNLNDAPKGKYYVVVMVEGTENYDTVSRTFEVDVDGKSNKGGLIAGIVVPIVVVAIAGAVVAIILVKKKKGKKVA